MLRIKNSKETIQIEHLNGGIKQLVDTIIQSKSLRNRHIHIHLHLLLWFQNLDLNISRFDQV